MPTSGATINVMAAHGRGSKPRHVQWLLVCLTTDLEYDPDDELDIISGFNNTSAPTIWKSAAAVGLAWNGPLNHYTKRTSASTNITVARWGLKAVATW
jgi:hypothetical protein